jgi:nucleoside-diphosphate-sugar epimerase
MAATNKATAQLYPHKKTRVRAPWIKRNVAVCSSSGAEGSNSINNICVVGASGRIGRRVVELCRSRGINVIAICRDPSKLPQSVATTVHKLEITEESSLEDLARFFSGCDAVISCQGTSRLTSLSDVWDPYHGHSDRGHPYHVNFLAVQRLLEAARRAGTVKRFVRITGLSAARSPSHPFAFLFNLILSKTVVWQQAGEESIKKSGIPFTVIRPGALTNDPRGPDQHILLAEGEPEKGQATVKIGRDDVAELIVESLFTINSENKFISCVWGRNDNASSSTSCPKTANEALSLFHINNK